INVWNEWAGVTRAGSVLGERARQKRAERHGFRAAVWSLENQGQIGRVLDQDLAAGAAGHAGTPRLRHDREPAKSRRAPRDGAEDRVSLRADREAQADALHVHPRMDHTLLVLERRRDAELRVRRVRAIEEGAGGFEERAILLLAAIRDVGTILFAHEPLRAFR